MPGTLEDDTMPAQADPPIVHDLQPELAQLSSDATGKDEQASDILNNLPTAASAIFQSDLHDSAPLCSPGTRVDLLDQIQDWIGQKDSTTLY